MSMKRPDENKLDNPVWYSLSESHKPFAIDHGNIKFYEPDYSPFGGFLHTTGISKHIDEYATMIDSFYILGEKPVISTHLQMSNEVKCFQMILDKTLEVDVTEDIRALNEDDAGKLFELVNLVQPGYIKRKTALLGMYFGIFKDDVLVAVTGERMRMNEFTEVSAVCTLPGYTGKGYASQLLAHTVNKIFAENKIPYLHVAESNTGAIKLYEKLGFKTRRKISAWNIVRKL